MADKYESQVEYEKKALAKVRKALLKQVAKKRKPKRLPLLARLFEEPGY